MVIKRHEPIGSIEIDGDVFSDSGDPIGRAHLSAGIVVAVSGAGIYAGGDFSTVNGLPRTNLIGVGASTVAVSEASPGAGFMLRGVAPNPARGALRVEYEVGRASRVRIGVYDIQGREVARLVDGMRPAGRQDARWDGRDPGGVAARPGIYVVRYEAAGRIESRRVALLR